MKHTLVTICLILLVLATVTPAILAAGEKSPSSAAITTHIPGSEIRIATDYHGKRLLIYGVTEPGCDIIIRLTSKDSETVAFAKKGRVGVFWLTTGRITFENVSSMYKIKSTKPLDQLLPKEKLISMGLGKNSLYSSIVTPKDTPRFLITDLIALKEQEKLYSFHADGVSLIKNNLFETTFFWPAKAPSGEYTVQSIAVKDSKVVSVDSETVKVKKVGLEGWMSRLSDSHGAAYGFLAIFVAIASGLLVGLIFRGIGGGKRKGLRTVH